jgi:hypothetical protein
MIRTTMIAAALAGGFALATPATAAPLAPASAAIATAGSTNLVEQVQYRRYYGPRYGYYGRGYRYNRGAAVGAGIAAGALGALAAGAPARARAGLCRAGPAAGLCCAPTCLRGAGCRRDRLLLAPLPQLRPADRYLYRLRRGVVRACP